MSKETAWWVGAHNQATEETQGIFDSHHDCVHDHTYLQNDGQTPTTHVWPTPESPTWKENVITSKNTLCKVHHDINFKEKQ